MVQFTAAAVIKIVKYVKKCKMSYQFIQQHLLRMGLKLQLCKIVFPIVYLQKYISLNEFI